MNKPRITNDEYATWHKIDKQRILKLVERAETAEAELRDIKLMAKPVCATAKNTSAVRSGHELGGYIKHYIVPTHLITALKGKS